MESHLLPILGLFFCLVLAGSYASKSGENYWHSALPNTPFPKALQDLFDPDRESSNIFMDEVKDEMDTSTLYYAQRYSASTKGFSDIPEDVTTIYNSLRHSASTKGFSELPKDVTTIYNSPRQSASTKGFSEIPEDAIAIYYSPRYSASIKGFAEIPDDVTTIYNSPRHPASTINTKGISEIPKDIIAKNSLQDRTIFYLYNDLHPGQKMTLLFTNAGNKVDFLPRNIVESIPFSTNKVPEILNRFSIDPESTDAEVVKDTIRDCENPQKEMEVKYCATSLESLVDQSVARLGKNIRVLSTPEGKRQEYTVLDGMKKIGDDRVVICHKERYPYAVYYCHEINDTEVYTVPLMGADATKVKAVTICHKDTSAWSPDYIAFEILKMKPGPPFCHFLYSDVLVWFQAKDLGHDLIPYLYDLLKHGISI